MNDNVKFFIIGAGLLLLILAVVYATLSQSPF